MISVEQLNVKNILYWYSDVVLTDEEPIHPCAKYIACSSRCEFSDKYIKFTKRLGVLNCCSECPSVFFTDAKINYK